MHNTPTKNTTYGWFETGFHKKRVKKITVCGSAWVFVGWESGYIAASRLSQLAYPLTLPAVHLSRQDVDRFIAFVPRWQSCQDLFF
jgi:hypothetical protein